MDAQAYRDGLRAWLDTERATLAEFREPDPDPAAEVAKLRRLQRVLYDAGWFRYGWAPELGGLGGEPRLRAVLAEELAVRGYPPPFSFALAETLAPAVARFDPELAARFVPPLLAGDDTWCLGFSEPEAGSDLASLRTRAEPDGTGGFVITGQKVWTSFAQYATRCVLLARTGPAESRHRGLTAFLVDMDSPGIELRPLRTMSGGEEFCETYLDGARVPADRVIGEVDGGWPVLGFMLASERGAIGAQRQAFLRCRLEALVAEAGAALDPVALGRVYAALHGLRLCTRRTLDGLAAGRLPGPETSVDKALMSATEQALFDLALDAMRPELVAGDDPSARRWREEYFFSRVATVYGGTSEIQRDLIADHVLGLPRDRS
jgi:alkylation response protein AidB-like acyl-CoA dehydrogenase